MDLEQTEFRPRENYEMAINTQGHILLILYNFLVFPEFFSDHSDIEVSIKNLASLKPDPIGDQEKW